MTHTELTSVKPTVCENPVRPPKHGEKSEDLAATIRSKVQKLNELFEKARLEGINVNLDVEQRSHHYMGGPLITELEVSLYKEL